MIKKIKENKNIILLALMVVITCITQIITLMKSSIVAGIFGVSSEMDAYNFSNNMVSFIFGIIASGIPTIIIPSYVKREDRKITDSFLTVIVCMIIAGFATVGKEGIVLLFQHGMFTSQDAHRVYVGALIYIIGQQTDVVRDLLYRYFYAKGDTKTTALNSMIISIINIILSISLIFLFDFYGIILGTILASVVSLVMIIVKFNKFFKIDITIGNLSGQYIKNLIIMVGTIFVVMNTKIILGTRDAILSIFIFGGETVLIYFVLTYLTNKKVLNTLKRI